ncbi:thiol reductant ABC exporter subunit CydD [Larsenimonas suaedae]|uniref:Thiol reductant ABC exporter subunit CydD n=1 Tax=Larsenimonas suaedae TaxID=1851019 RepID=A0ABU1GV51_9GAMM|nr:thiol reductant ABC exporter subunit CydD [Larsenimonas suaedae]MCM2971691.1 thiol reductant ABC exporter subunit CydD [Larsenimonas suaedae]MDR5895243.1 thiol reductant ABC exporter subunit CydD [Larsenimonas suaedae]
MPSPLTARQWLSRHAKRATPWPQTAVAAALVSTLCLFVQAWAIASIAQEMVLGHADPLKLWLPLAVLPLAFFARGGLAWLKTVAGTRAGIHVRQSIRADVFERIGERGPLWAQRQHSATLGNRVWDQVDALHGYYADYRPQVILSALIPLMILVVVFPLNWAAGVILLVTGPLIPMNMALIGMGAKSRQKAQFQEMARMSRHFSDTLRGLPTLKLFGLGRQQAGAIYKVSEAFRRQTMRVLRLAFLSSTALEFFASVSIAILAIYIGFVYLGKFEFGGWGHGLDLFTGLFILILAPEFYQPLRELGTHYHAKAEAEAAADDLMALLASEESASESATYAEWTVPASLGLTLKGVCAHYNGHSPNAIDTLDLELAPNTTTAIVGPSGAGKSTLLALITRALAPSEGALYTHDGQPLSDISVEQWRKALGWVGQRSALLTGTLADNLRLANPALKDEALWEALSDVGLAAWATELPQGLATRLGEGGQPVSGGQARRIALARAILRDAPLILLDEPTASLDQQSERDIIEVLARLKATRTLVILTHRLDLLSLADQIVRLERCRGRTYSSAAQLADVAPNDEPSSAASFQGDTP